MIRIIEEKMNKTQDIWASLNTCQEVIMLLSSLILGVINRDDDDDDDAKLWNIRYYSNYLIGYDFKNKFDQLLPPSFHIL